MIISINFALNVKFRAFGITFGSVSEAGWVGVNPETKGLSWGLETGVKAPTSARTVVDRSGISLKVWL